MKLLSDHKNLNKRKSENQNLKPSWDGKSSYLQENLFMKNIGDAPA